MFSLWMSAALERCAGVRIRRALYRVSNGRRNTVSEELKAVLLLSIPI